jgi:branched-chain amino acid transport system permease protein
MMQSLTGFATYGSYFLTMALISGIACLGLNLQWGQTGLFNAGIAGFIAIGAYTSALLTTAPFPGRLGGFGLPIAVGLLGAMAAAGGGAALIGATTLRLRSDYLAITTFGVAVAVELVLRNATSLSGGTFGISFIPRAFESLAARPLPFGLANLLLAGALAALTFAALERLTRSPCARQECVPLPAAGVRNRRRTDGSGRRAAGASDRLHRS